MRSGRGCHGERNPARKHQKAQSKEQPPSAEDSQTVVTSLSGTFTFSSIVTCGASATSDAQLTGTTSGTLGVIVSIGAIAPFGTQFMSVPTFARAGDPSAEIQ